ncbi:hypothetical protein [Rhodococcoides yunnanense]|uniref:hypothetical protein n=1 Tax=Rhodococcoides yunnanense TaxID=278209 RepID=UPI0009340237|nr:hypothetical protein [Rhodococcus yunnanensis]
MDKRQSIASGGVDAIRALTPDRDITTAWSSVEKKCFDAGAAYLAAMERFDGDRTPAAQRAFDDATRALGDASRALDSFYEAHRTELEQARAMLAATPRLAQDAKALAEKAQLAVASAPEEFTGYPSIRTAWRTLDSAVAALDARMGARDALGARSAAAEVRGAAETLESAVAAAPAKDKEARSALASVKTRTEAVRTRSGRLAPAFSTLLREFNAASSADLSGNEKSSDRHIDQATEDLSAARAAAGSGNPEQALEYIAQARAHLADAEALVDAVTDRVELLRAVKSNPREKEQAVRFTLRDAQQLAVNRGLVAEWGSVLDAQLARIERARNALTGTHPDYWSYLQDLDSISHFIAGVIDRMRGSAR